MRASALLLFSLVLASGLACGKKTPPPKAAEVPMSDVATPAPAAPPPLYDRLGGKDGVAGIVESFVSNVAADKRINKFFAKTTGAKLDYFKSMLNLQICEVSGGGCDYSGKSMKDAHAGMKILDAQFDAIVQDLTLALEEKQVPADVQKELLAKILAMHDDIVAPKGK